MRDHILTVLDREGDLPPLPEIVLRMHSLIRDPHSNARSLADLIALDPVLAGRIIRLANSAWYARSPEPIKTLPVAISKIGLNMLIRLVYSLKLVGLFDEGEQLDSQRFWEHSIAIAVFTQVLSKRMKASPDQSDIAYLSGLMHDIGVIVFSHIIPNEYGAFLHDMQQTADPLEIREMEEFGIDHAELGASFIERWWNMDERIVSSVRHHHQAPGSIAPDRPVEELVRIAHAICNRNGVTNGVRSSMEVYPAGDDNTLGFSAEELDSMSMEVREAVENAREIISISGGAVS